VLNDLLVSSHKSQIDKQLQNRQEFKFELKPGFKIEIGNKK
jgi:hypothetical protein